MSKTTRKNKPISKVITYQQRDVVKSLTVDGANDLMDLETDKGHVTLVLSRDSTKLNVSTFTAFKKENTEKISKIEEDISNLKLTIQTMENSLDNMSNQINMVYNSMSENIVRLEEKINEIEKSKK